MRGLESSYPASSLQTQKRISPPCPARLSEGSLSHLACHVRWQMVPIASTSLGPGRSPFYKRSLNIARTNFNSRTSPLPRPIRRRS